MSSAAIRALVSGYPRRLWGAKLLVMLQAFIDDSASQLGNRRLFLAAYVHSAEAWIEFSNEWDSVLRADPAIEYFKMAEAASRGGQFKKFSEGQRNRKIIDLAKVIWKHRPWGFHASVNITDFNNILKPHVPHPMKTPYFPLCYAVMFGVARVHHSMAVNVPCDFIFDHQDGLAAKVVPLFDLVLASRPEPWIGLVSGTPTFKDDKEVLPIQAADMLAWFVRRVDDGNLPEKIKGLGDLLIFDGAQHCVDVDTETLERLAQGFQKIPNVGLIQSKKDWKRILPGVLEDFERAQRGEPSEYAKHRAAHPDGWEPA